MNKQLVFKGAAFVFILIIVFLLIFPKKIEIIEVGTIPKKFSFQQGLLIDKYEPKSKQINTLNSMVSDKTIYLTFDDGPSFLTRQILDILKENEIPATFFVVGSKIEGYTDIIEREYYDGHTVAVHSDTHNYRYIYSSLDNYLTDLNSVRHKVHKITGSYSRIVRLPGGASNTVSKKYKEGIVTEITNWLNQNDYYYFDWNVDSLDASGKVSKEIIFNSVTSHLKKGNNIVLMHDSSTKQTTVDALPYIIEYAKANGYTFARITKHTLPYHHNIRN